ncbi:MAG: polyprenyl synthetase family protein [Chlorobi bacterium]|nr:polyprenyl synthetase family protein [Chlorobiota bacterium]
MASLREINAPIAEDINAFRKIFRETVRSRVPLLDLIMRYILKTKGKQMRPMFVMYSAGILGKINETTYRAATMIELMHTATLVHDDVVDDSFQRRGRFSVNYLWKNKIAVLAGDFLLSRGMLLALENKDYHLLEIISKAVKDMSEGELLQLEKARKLDISEDVYYEIIRKKTAALLASSMATGAASVTDDETLISKMHSIGENAGMAFQIRDDLFDLQGGNDSGKPTGIDIKEKKMTLPLIFLLQQSSRSEKRKIINIVKNDNENPEKVSWLIEQIRKSGGFDYSIKKMEEFNDKALDMLDSLPDNTYRHYMKKLIEYNVERKK